MKPSLRDGRTVMSRSAWEEAGEPAATVTMALDEALKRAEKMTVTRLSEETGISRNNLDKLKNGHAAGVTYVTLAAICTALDCEPGDLLVYTPAPVVMDDEEYERFLAEQNRTGQAAPAGALG